MLPHWDGVYRRTDWSALSSMFCKAEKACTVALTETRPSDWTIMVMQLLTVWDYHRWLHELTPSKVPSYEQ